MIKMMQISHLTLIVFLISARSSFCDDNAIYPITPNSTLSRVDELSFPISVQAGIIPDGGTLMFAITDRLTNRLDICIDGRNPHGTNLVTRHVYVARHPTSLGARQLNEEGSEAKLLADILKKWMESSFSQQERASLDIKNTKRFKEAFAVSLENGHRYATGCHVLRLLRRLNQRKSEEPNKPSADDGKKAAPHSQRSLSPNE
jgi:hypothetical protein